MERGWVNLTFKAFDRVASCQNERKRMDHFAQRDAPRICYDNFSMLVNCWLTLHHCGSMHCFPLYGLDV